jgi:hypothetical protein
MSEEDAELDTDADAMPQAVFHPTLRRYEAGINFYTACGKTLRLKKVCVLQFPPRAPTVKGFRLVNEI